MAEVRRPEPPPGYMPFKWKTKPYEHDRNIKVQLCPVCDNFGSAWHSGGFADQGAQKFYEELLAANDGYCSFEVMLTEYEGAHIRDHWSRYGEGECTDCGVKYWHDFVGYPWRYYYNPETGKIRKPYQASLF